jgi:hypothetical protein
MRCDVLPEETRLEIGRKVQREIIGFAGVVCALIALSWSFGDGRGHRRDAASTTRAIDAEMLVSTAAMGGAIPGDCATCDLPVDARALRPAPSMERLPHAPRAQGESHSQPTHPLLVLYAASRLQAPMIARSADIASETAQTFRAALARQRARGGQVQSTGPPDSACRLPGLTY